MAERGDDPALNGTAPPRPPFALTVGITGHRVGAVPRAAIEAAADRVDAVLADLARAADGVRGAHAQCFADAPTRLTLISPLASGADQLATRLALARDYALQVILPFERSIYAQDFVEPGERAAFDALIACAGSTLEMPGTRAAAEDAYVAVGRAVTAHADVLVALWDGEPARGRGGTAEIVEHALRRGMPVIHVPIDPALPTRLLWTAFEDVPPDVLDAADAPARACDPAGLDRLVTQLLAPPTAQEERDCIAAFFGERQRSLRLRIEYPLLLVLLGIHAPRAVKLRVAPYAGTVADEWQGFHRGCGAAERGVAGGFAALEEAYCWSDKLADHYAGEYRSGHVANFVLAALATVCALAELIAAHQIHPALIFAELFLIALFVINTRVGVHSAWHRRWLDYRHLAEQLRPMRGLKLFALARPPGAVRRRGRRRWIDWYAAAYWRAMGAPHGRLGEGAVVTSAALMVAEELAPQITYHQANAERMHRIERRLHGVANALFYATVLSLAGALLVHAMHLSAPMLDLPHALLEYLPTPTHALVALTAGMPAIAAALHAIREQGEFARTARRSTATAAALARLADDLGARPIALPRAAGLAEEAVRVMLDDLGEWRMAYEMRDLALPA